MIGKNTIHEGDFIELSKNIESGSVDLIVTDLPYGTVTNIADNDKISHGMKNKTAWDVAINPKIVHEIANRILRKNGKAIFFSQEPYTTNLVSNAVANMPFCYRMIWEKDHFANSLIAKKAPVNFYEDVLVFSKKHDYEGLHPLRHYFKKVLDFIGMNLKSINKTLGHRRAEHSFYVTPRKVVIGKIGGKADHVTRIGSSQFSLCTEKTYNELIEVFDINKMVGFKPFSELKVINSTFNSTFNLPKNAKYKSNILKYKKDYTGLHPTQKPLLLIEDLIKTFSRKGDLVVDLTAGSMTTAIAALNTKRNYIMIEKDDKYFNVGENRINSHHKQKATQLFK